MPKQQQKKAWPSPAKQMHMVNHQNDRATTLIFKDYKFRKGFSESDFDQAALEAAR